MEHWMTAYNVSLYTFYIHSAIRCRAVGAGPADPVATGPIFGQLTHAKMPYELWLVVPLLLSKSSYASRDLG